MDSSASAPFDAAIILAGGAGNRLWPLSSHAAPKYLMEISPRCSLLQETVKRASALVRSTIVIVTHHLHINHVETNVRQMRGITKNIAILAEPDAKNTAPAIGLALCYLHTYTDATRAICMPADHLIRPLASFVQDAKRASYIAAQDYIALFGIKPHAPVTGYGYVERGDEIEGGHMVKRFHEKPDTERARAYFKNKAFFWNSGIFAFNTSFLWEELAKHEPGVVDPLINRGAELFHLAPEEGEAGAISVQRVTARLREAYTKTPSISIDYAVAERSKRIAMIEAQFRWNDVGSWDEVARLIDTQDMANPNSGSLLANDSANNTVISDQTVALCGINDIIVVVKDGVVLICKRGHSQHVKEIAIEYHQTEKRRKYK